REPVDAGREYSRHRAANSAPDLAISCLSRVLTMKRMPMGRDEAWPHEEFARVMMAAAVRWGVAVLAAGTLACAPDSSTSSDKLPPNIPDPNTVKTSSGALAFYRGAVATLPSPVFDLMVDSGILTDELADVPTPTGVGGDAYATDSRSALDES